MPGFGLLRIDRWREITSTLGRNKLRTTLTALSVSWGIFMLVVLHGAGSGLQNAVDYGFRDDAMNSIWMWGGTTSVPHGGHGLGRRIQLTNRDYDSIDNGIEAAEHITARYYLRNNLTVTYGGKTSSFDVRACHPGHLFLERTIIKRGRFINDRDLKHRRKIAVIGTEVARFFFADADPIGEWLAIKGIPYRVVGIFEDMGGESELEKIYIPISTAQTAYGGGERVNQLMFTIAEDQTAAFASIEAETRNMMARRHHFATDDRRALRVRNNVEQSERIRDLFAAIRWFVWIVGGFTIIAGVVGVSNIMLISVKERTKEIGIRKALGATPAEIISMLVQEAVMLTAVAGYLGLCAGVAVIETWNYFMPESEYLRNPQVDLGVAITAAAILVVAGAVAGYIPARRAARVDPVVALRDS